MTGTERSGERSPDERRVELEELRAELGETVEELARRADVPSRLREMRDETAQRAREQVAHARETIAETAPVVQSTLRDRARARDEPRRRVDVPADPPGAAAEAWKGDRWNAVAPSTTPAWTRH